MVDNNVAPLTQIRQHHLEIPLGDPPIAILVDHREGLFELLDLLRRELGERPAGSFSRVVREAAGGQAVA
jgi:hypothetical protein